MQRIVTVFVGLAIAVVVAGCTSKAKYGVVSGKITYKNQPVNNSALLLYPAVGADPPLTITVPVDAEGNFKITDVPPGDYKVVVKGTKGAGEAPKMDFSKLPPEKAAEAKEKLAKMNTPPTIKFPTKYEELKTTKLTCKITESDDTMNLVLED
jgi:hypothetical protein